MFAIWKAFTRRKPIEHSRGQSQLKRCLGTLDLTSLGVGSTLGVGIYVIVGTVAANSAGPSVVLSFVIAAVSSIFAGLCYAEFGALVPKAGSAYIYSYISVGELMAFIIGWNLILEYIIGTASVARSYSNYLDALFNGQIEKFLSRYLKLPKSKWFSSYPDLVAFSLSMLLSIMLVIGVKESTQFTTIFTGLNFFVILYCIIVGLFKIDFHNWNISPSEIPIDVDGGKGGFFPYGIKGMISGAATCFYSFVGFDAIATTGEEVLDPQRSLPISIILSLLIVTFAYCGVSAVQTMMWPYWDQNQKAPLPYVFGQVGYPFAKNVITIGALAGLSTSLLGAMFPLPRVIYAMASDSLLFKFLANISPRFKTPAIATLLSGFLTGLMAIFFNVEELAEMMSIGTLLAYSLVAISILILRYKKESHDYTFNDDIAINVMSETQENLYEGSYFARIWNCHSSTTADTFSSNLSLILIGIISLFIIALNVVLTIYEDDLYALSLPIEAIVTLAVLFVLMLLTIICLHRQPMVSSDASFKVPLVPYIPLLSVFANTYLMVHLNELTWYRFIGWMILGFIIYFTYGIVKSVGYLTTDEKNRLFLDTPTDIADAAEDTENFET